MGLHCLKGNLSSFAFCYPCCTAIQHKVNHIKHLAYLNGYEAGRKAATPDLLLRTFREVLLSIDSIGPTRADAIMKKLSDTFDLKEKADEPAEGDGTPEETEGTAEEVQSDGLPE